MSNPEGRPFVSRGGEKLDAALRHFGLDVTGKVCADLGSHVGGFVDCLRQHGAARVFSVDTAYGVLAWKLRKDPRVVVLERTNAMHVELPEPVDLVTIDVGWTPQAKVLPRVATLLKPGGHVITLIKPHYEAPPERLRGGVLTPDAAEEVLGSVLHAVKTLGWSVQGTLPSPLLGHGGNREYLALLEPAAPDAREAPGAIPRRRSEPQP
ncbi:MAG TPA: TlyA family RNA methyltransferase [Phycisphaerae bacterium]|nr:TlyA family RNA methyltransferase [Phycisphaerae bacterium]HNU44143.1 TlyA family RNA methyltransferase [Phycisphaerae bacterium]